MAAEGDGDEVFHEDEEGAEGTKNNPLLLKACEKNDTGTALNLITNQKASATCEDERQWSPLIWAAHHGNVELTRVLISLGAAKMYKYDESQGKKKKKKHSPLHWAAYRGKMKVMWLLLFEKLSHHEKDQIGNTALHQAAAGGAIECTKCLMSQGCDVFAKNDRGHTPYDLCTAPEVQQLLKKAMETSECKATHKQFSATVLRYLCSWSLDVFCETAVQRLWVFESPEADEREKPVTWCLEVKSMVNEAERNLENALHLNQLETITAALAAAEDKPVDCKLLHKCLQLKAKLESEIQLVKAMQVQVITNLDDSSSIHEALTKAIDEAEEKGADPVRVEAAKMLRRKLLSEVSLMRAVNGPQKTTTGHLLMLQELTDAAKAENANEELLNQATKLITKLRSEREVQQCIAECKAVCEFSSFKDIAGKDGLPEWIHITDQFEDFHEKYKDIVDRADKNEITKSLMDTALEQLATIEHILIEKKQMEAEGVLKASKKKKKM